MRPKLWLSRLEDVLLFVLVALSVWGTIGLWRSLPDLYIVPQRGVYLPKVLGPGLVDAPPVIAVAGAPAGPRLFFPNSRSFDRLWQSLKAALAAAGRPAETASGAAPVAPYVAFPLPAGLGVGGSDGFSGGEVVLPAGGGLGRLLMGDTVYTFPSPALPPLPTNGGVPALPVTARPGALAPSVPLYLPSLTLEPLSTRQVLALTFSNPLVVREVPADEAVAGYSDGTAVLKLYAGGGFRYERPEATHGRERSAAAVLAASVFASEHPLLEGGGLVSSVHRQGGGVLVTALPTHGGLPLLGETTVYQVDGDTVLSAEGTAVHAVAGALMEIPGAALLGELPQATALKLAYTYLAYVAQGSSATPALVAVLQNGQAYALRQGQRPLLLRGGVP